MSDKRTQAYFFGMVLKLARSLGITRAQIVHMFSASNIRSGWEIVNGEKHEQQTSTL